MLKLIAVMFSFFIFAHTALAQVKERAVEVTVNIDLQAPAESKNVRLWIPYPASNESQTVYDVRVEGNYSKSGVYKEKTHSNSALYAEWTSPSAERSLAFIFKVKRKEVIKKDFPVREARLDKSNLRKYLMGTSHVPVKGTVKDEAEKIVSGKKTALDKSRIIYDYIVDNWERDPGVPGCGPGDVLTLLETKKGKCADIHSVYVAFARAAGVPSREVFGIRIPKAKFGDMTKAQHCWAEFYLPGRGWVPVDPSDVLKYVLEKKIPKSEAKEQREYYFGAVDENRIEFGTGRDFKLNPSQKADAINYFMYPYAEVDGKPMDCLATEDFKYKISYKEL